jgi:hypothetical protein
MVDGQVIEGKFGSSIALNGNGEPMAVVDSEDVRMYDLVVNDNDKMKWIMVETIPAPENATEGIRLSLVDSIWMEKPRLFWHIGLVEH